MKIIAGTARSMGITVEGKYRQHQHDTWEGRARPVDHDSTASPDDTEQEQT